MHTGLKKSMTMKNMKHIKKTDNLKIKKWIIEKLSYLKMHEATMSYVNYINNCEDKTPDEKLTCFKNLFDRTVILKEILIKAEVYVLIKTKQNNLIIFTRIWNWISIRIYTHEFTVFTAVSLTFLAKVFSQNN